jgi:acid phosphatase
MAMYKISRRSFLAGATLFVTAKGRVSATGTPDLTFLVLGDWGTGAAEPRKVAVQMAKAATVLGADFVISTGDNFYPDGVSSVDDPQWQTSFEGIFPEPALQIPWYVVLGNHDHRGSTAAQVSYSDVSARWNMPANYYKLTQKLADGSLVDFFFLDTHPIHLRYRNWIPRLFDDNQLVWLEQELTASKARWKIAIGHYPVFSGGKHGTSTMVKALKPLFDEHGVRVYVNGHNHTLEHVVVGATHYLTCGAGAKPRKASPVSGSRFTMGERLGFMTARLKPDAMQVAFLDEQGQFLYEATIPSI